MPRPLLSRLATGALALSGVIGMPVDDVLGSGAAPDPGSTTSTATMAGAAAVTLEAPPTAPAGTCSALVPGRVAVGRPSTTVPVTLGPDCAAAGVTYATWDAHHPAAGLQDLILFDGTSTEEWTLFDWQPIGRWQWKPMGAYTADYAKVDQRDPYYTDVRLGSAAELDATRSGSRVTLRTTATRYWQDGGRFIAWAGATGQLQSRTPGATTWSPLKDVETNSAGTYTWAHATAERREYRVVLRDAANRTIWGSTSATVRR